MISILIPTYNAVCLPLIEKVHSQAVALQIPFEILLADDASREDIRQQNRKITDRKSTRLNSSHCLLSRMPSSA